MNRNFENRTRESKTPGTNGHTVTNFMGGISYKLDPVETLKLVSASSIFGEPQYYRDGEFATKTLYHCDCLFVDYNLLNQFEGETTTKIFERCIDDALSADFEKTLDWAVELRRDYNMRLNPQVIMVRAAMHPGRRVFTSENPNKFDAINQRVMARADDVISQMTYYLYINGSKNKLPAILKRSWAKNIAAMTRYEMAKYRNHGLGLIDVIRLSHAKGPLVTELVKTGTIETKESEKTWETLRSNGASWDEILKQINMPYMALLRNLVNIFSEISDYDICRNVMSQLVDKVGVSKQFPYRFMIAYQMVEAATARIADPNNYMQMLIGLEYCMDKSCQNLPKLPGNNAFLSDNSGSAWGAIPSEYGRVKVAKINNLSAVIGAVNSEKGTVFPFGDRLLAYPIQSKVRILEKAKDVTEFGHRVGKSTENGVWLFFKNAIDKHEIWDNIFIYSDQQAGHGGLYGTDDDAGEYAQRGYLAETEMVRLFRTVSHMPYIDVAKLIADYRAKVNPKVNVFTVQTAGYDNVMVPENGYRTSILYGWTGRELVYADMINRFWDEFDAKHNA